MTGGWGGDSAPWAAERQVAGVPYLPARQPSRIASILGNQDNGVHGVSL